MTTKRLSELLTFSILLLSALILSFLFYKMPLLYYLLFFFSIGYLRYKKSILYFSFFLLLYLLFKTHWGFNVLGYKYGVLLFVLALMYFLSFFMLIFFKDHLFFLFIPVFIFSEYIWRSHFFPGIVISYPFVNIIGISLPITPFISSLLLSFILCLTRWNKKGMLIAIAIIILIGIPYRKKDAENSGFNIIGPTIEENASITNILKDKKGYDGVILPEYIFNRNFEKDKDMIRDIFAGYFENNGFLAFGFVKDGKSWAALFSSEAEIFVPKLHPVVFLEKRSNEKRENGIRYKENDLVLMVCHDVFFIDDIMRYLKRGDTLILPVYIPEKWGYQPRSSMNYAIQYLKNNGIGVYRSDFGD